MAKMTSALLVLALIAMPFLNAMEVAGRTLPPPSDHKLELKNNTNNNDPNKLYGDAKWFDGLLPFLLHPWLLGHPWFGPGPFWWLKDDKTTNTTKPSSSSAHHESPKVPKGGSTLGKYAPSTTSP